MFQNFAEDHAILQTYTHGDNAILFPFHFQGDMPKETNFNAIKLKTMSSLVLLCFEKHHGFYVGIAVL